MAKIDDLKNKQGETIYPRTLTEAVYEGETNEKLSTKIAEYDAHVADNTAIKHKAREIQLINSKFTSTNVEAGMGELFTNVSNGKDLVGGAITGVDDSIVIPADPTFNDLASAIGSISTGKKWASGDANIVNNVLEVSGLNFKASIIIVHCVELRTPITYYIKGLHEDYYENRRSSSTTSWEHLDGVNSYIRNTGFRINAVKNSRTEPQKWIAFE